MYMLFLMSASEKKRFVFVVHWQRYCRCIPCIYIYIYIFNFQMAHRLGQHFKMKILWRYYWNLFGENWTWWLWTTEKRNVSVSRGHELANALCVFYRYIGLKIKKRFFLLGMHRHDYKVTNSAESTQKRKVYSGM